MAGPNFVLDKGFLAETAVVQFAAVKTGTADGTCTAVTTAGDMVLGIAQEVCETADLGSRVINVRLLGISRALAAAALTRGTRVRTNATGQMAALAGTAGLVENVAGIVITASGAANDQFDVLLTPGVTVNTAVS